MKRYEVLISQVWSEEVYVTANNAREAKAKAWLKWKAKKKNYTIEACSE